MSVEANAVQTMKDQLDTGMDERRLLYCQYGNTKWHMTYYLGLQTYWMLTLSDSLHELHLHLLRFPCPFVLIPQMVICVWLILDALYHSRWCNISIIHVRRSLNTFPTSEKKIENTIRSGVFFTNLKVFGNVIRHLSV